VESPKGTFTLRSGIENGSHPKSEVYGDQEIALTMSQFSAACLFGQKSGKRDDFWQADCQKQETSN
jgi:hypothetical protein